MTKIVKVRFLLLISWLSLVMMLCSSCAPFATETLYKSKNLQTDPGLNQVLIAKPTIINFEENRERLIQRTFFPLLSGHWSRYEVDCIEYEGDAEALVAANFENVYNHVPYYARYLLVGQITRKKPTRKYSDVVVEYRLFDIRSKELLLYTQFDSTLGIPKFDVRNTTNLIHSIPAGGAGPFIIFVNTEEYIMDEIKFIGEALLKGLRTLEITYSLGVPGSEQQYSK